MKKMTAVLMVVVGLLCLNIKTASAEVVKMTKDTLVAIVIKNVPMTDGTVQAIWASGFMADPSPVYFPVRIRGVVEVLLLAEEIKPLDHGKTEDLMDVLANVVTPGPVGEGEFVVVWNNRCYLAEGNPRYPHAIVIDLNEEAPDYVTDTIRGNFKHTPEYREMDALLRGYTLRK
jgi:hypothetical protein